MNFGKTCFIVINESESQQKKKWSESQQKKMQQKEQWRGAITVTLRFFWFQPTKNIFLKNVNTFSVHHGYLNLGNKQYFKNTCPLHKKNNV